MPKKRRKRNEIVVFAPSFRSREDALLKDTTGAEALDVFKVCEKIGRCLSGLMIAVGVLLSLLSVLSIATFIELVFSSPFFVGALGFLGAINLFCGLLLLAKK